MSVKAEDVDSDSDSSLTKIQRLGNNKRAVRGESATAWDAVKAYSTSGEPNDNDWQSLMDDSWNEFMSNVEHKQVRKTSAHVPPQGLGIIHRS